MHILTQAAVLAAILAFILASVFPGARRTAMSKHQCKEFGTKLPPCAACAKSMMPGDKQKLDIVL